MSCEWSQVTAENSGFANGVAFAYSCSGLTNKLWWQYWPQFVLSPVSPPACCLHPFNICGNEHTWQAVKHVRVIRMIYNSAVLIVGPASIVSCQQIMKNAIVHSNFDRRITRTSFLWENYYWFIFSFVFFGWTVVRWKYSKLQDGCSF